MLDLSNLIATYNLSLYDTEIVKENNTIIYRIYIIKDGGVNLDDCEKVSHLLSPIFDVEPPLDGEWFLEVSSPGLERKLKRIEHFKLSIGELVKITLNNKNEISGKLLLVNGNEIHIENSPIINFEDIKKAKTYIQW